MPAVMIQTKDGHDDKEVWNFLLANDVNIIPMGNGITSADVPKRLFPKLETMAHVTPKKQPHDKSIRDS